MLTPTLVIASPFKSRRCVIARGRVGLVCAVVVGLASFSLAASASLGASAAPSGSHEKAQNYLGVNLHDTTDEEVGALHLQGPHGAEVTAVDHDGPAGKAGLQLHDIVLQLNGQNIENADELRRKIREASPGSGVSLSIMRQGRAMTVTTKLANRQEVDRLAWEHMSQPESPQAADDVQNVLVERYNTEGVPAKPRGQSFIGSVLRIAPYTGASLETMEPQLAGFFGAPPKTGLLVHAVDANSPAALAGLRAGDVILRVDSASVASTSEWAKHLRASNGHAVNLTILRDKHEQTLTLQADLKKHSMVEWPKLF